MGEQNYLVIVILAVMAGLLFLVYRWFTGKRYPQKTSAMLDTVPDLEQIGLKRDANGYSGKYRDFLVYLYATTSMKPMGPYGGNKFQVWVIAAPQPGQLKGLGGFFGKYLVAGEKPGYAMVGFLINFNATSTPAEDIRVQLDELITALRQNEVAPYVM